MQNKLMSMSVLMAAMMGVGLVGCSKPAEKTEQTKTETKRHLQQVVTPLRWDFTFTLRHDGNF
jgi:hypothetical protein